MRPATFLVYSLILALPIAAPFRLSSRPEERLLAGARPETTTSQKDTAASQQEEAPDWAKREYDFPAKQVYAAALKSILLQKHDVKANNETTYTIEFHVGVTAWSWGYNMRLVVTPLAENRSKVTVGVLRSGGKVFSWGSGKKEVRKILAGIDAELASPRGHVAGCPTLRV